MEETPKKTILEEIKNDLDELEVQLNLGKKELQEAFEAKKKKFTSLIKQVQLNLDEYEKTGSEKVKELKDKAADLIDTLESNFDVSYTDYSDKPHSLKRVVEDFEKVVKDYYIEVEGKSKEATSKAKTEIKLGIEKFKHELEIQQAQLKQLKEKSSDEWESWKKTKQEEIGKLKEKINSAVDSSKEKAGKFNEELTEAYRHLKTAFKNLA